MGEIQRVAVIGAGIMGRGIAHVCALNDFKIVLQDLDDQILSEAQRTIDSNMSKSIELGKLLKIQKEKSLNNLTLTTSLSSAVEQADLIIEAVPENLELKQNVFSQVEKICPSDAVLATNTSSMSVTEIFSSVSKPDRTIGLHFFNPVHIMKLVEIVSGLETSTETLEACVNACRQMKKETVQINEFPGFVTTRINALIGNEAFNMLQEGLGTPEDIDRAVKLGLKHPMGPFEMIDLVGLDTRLKIMEYLHQTLGEKYRPAPLMVQYVNAGRLGRKTGRGVYEYSGEDKWKK